MPIGPIEFIYFDELEVRTRWILLSRVPLHLSVHHIDDRLRELPAAILGYRIMGTKSNTKNRRK
jgi:hypothetical protein